MVGWGPKAAAADPPASSDGKRVRRVREVWLVFEIHFGRLAEWLRRQL
jgi:hypothetical protein